MYLTKISASGELTLSQEIQQLLHVRPGDKLSFLQNENGEIVVRNASEAALLEAQCAFAGVAEDLGLSSDDDIQQIVNEMRV